MKRAALTGGSARSIRADQLFVLRFRGLTDDNRIVIIISAIVSLWLYCRFGAGRCNGGEEYDDEVC